MGMPITPVGIVSFPDLFVARAAMDGGTEKFAVTLIFDAKTDLKELKKAVKDCVAEEYPKGPPKGFKNPFRKTEEKDGAGYDDCPGGVFVSFRSKKKPAVVGPNPAFEIAEETGDVYPGCSGRVTYRPYCYDVNGNRGVTFNLYSFQKTGDGEPLTTRSSPVDDFGVIEETAPEGAAAMFE